MNKYSYSVYIYDTRCISTENNFGAHMPECGRKRGAIMAFDPTKYKAPKVHTNTLEYIAKEHGYKVNRHAFTDQHRSLTLNKIGDDEEILFVNKTTKEIVSAMGW